MQDATGTDEHQGGKTGGREQARSGSTIRLREGTTDRHGQSRDRAGGSGDKPRKNGIFGVLNRRFGLTGGFFVGSILESTIVPVPIEAAMIPVMIARRERIWHVATAVLAGCIVGVIAAWLVGAYLFEPVARPLIEFFGVEQGFEEAKTRFQEEGMATIVLIALSPIPLVLASLGAGVTGINPFAAIGFIVVTRAVRYYGMGVAAWYAGPWLKRAWDRLDNPWLKWGLILISVLALCLLFML